jgi:hypothetical protein
VVLYNDGGLANLTLALHAIYNTFVGVNTNSAFVHVSNADGTQMAAEVSDNIIYGTRTPVLIEKASAASATGASNWIQTNASPGPLTGSVQSASPGFRNAALKDYTLVGGSACIGAANTAVFGPPGREYFQNELTNRMWRIRAAARDIGAFESTTASTPVGPYDPVPRPRVGVGKAGANAALSWPLFAQDFQLYQSGVIVPGAWSLAPYAYVTDAVGVSASVPAGASNAFFRLKQ